MNIINDYPPNYEEIARAFPDAMGKVAFAYDHAIYNPWRLPVGPQNVAHEEVHFAQQDKIGVKEWWRRYIDDPRFRAEQELPAYRVEYRYLRDRGDRNKAAYAARHMAAALSGPNYGDCISFYDALTYITGGKV